MGAARQTKRARTEEVVDRLLEVAPDAIVVMGADGRMVRVNTQAEKLFEYSRMARILSRKPDSAKHRAP